MTSQVALLNLYGVALASDTLASRKVSDGFITTEGNSKIWSLGPNHKVVAMHYGSTMLGGVPHKIQFEAWARTLTKPLTNIQAYVTHYEKYCASPKSIHSRVQEGSDLEWIFKDALNRLNNQAFSEPETTDQDQKLQETAKNFGAFYRKANKFTGTNLEWLEQSITKFKLNLDDLIKQKFEQELPANIRTTIKRAMKQFALAAYELRTDTNLVFVGFGEKDEFAGSQRLQIRAIINGKALTMKEEALYVSPDDYDARIIYAAQADAMKALIQGYHTAFGNEIGHVVNGHLQSFFKDKKMESHYADQLTDKITESLADYSQNTFITPAFRAIVNMSPEQLAQAAKGLVILQTAAASIGAKTPTVGGPVDVVSLSREF